MDTLPFTRASSPPHLVLRNDNDWQHNETIETTTHTAAGTPNSSRHTFITPSQSDDDYDEEYDGVDRVDDLQMDGTNNIYNYTETHAQVWQAAGHWSHISNGNAVTRDQSNVPFFLGIVFGVMAATMWHWGKRYH